ncbi:hypothetical protein N8772_04305 [Rickettsiales bacterium]|nr:hypothetical protein [Rickettsiales bacterium]
MPFVIHYSDIISASVKPQEGIAISFRSTHDDQQSEVEFFGKYQELKDKLILIEGNLCFLRNIEVVAEFLITRDACYKLDINSKEKIFTLGDSQLCVESKNIDLKNAEQSILKLQDNKHRNFLFKGKFSTDDDKVILKDGDLTVYQGENLIAQFVIKDQICTKDDRGIRFNLKKPPNTPVSVPHAAGRREVTTDKRYEKCYDFR